jgi:hypothetical protein
MISHASSFPSGTIYRRLLSGKARSQTENGERQVVLVMPQSSFRFKTDFSQAGPVLRFKFAQRAKFLLRVNAGPSSPADNMLGVFDCPAAAGSPKVHALST